MKRYKLVTKIINRCFVIKKLSCVAYSSNRIKVMVGKNKLLIGSFSGKNDESFCGKLMQYKTIYKALRDLDWKIKLSFNEAMKHAYSDTVISEFNLIRTNTEEENWLII